MSRAWFLHGIRAVAALKRQRRLRDLSPPAAVTGSSTAFVPWFRDEKREPK